MGIFDKDDHKDDPKNTQSIGSHQKSSGRPTRSLQRYLDRIEWMLQREREREGGKESFSCFMTICYDTAAG